MNKVDVNFVNTGLDDKILKSLPTEDVSEDLVKAMNKQGLVQKEVQVQGKNGKTFTRKQWVKAGETSTDKSSSKPSSDDIKAYGYDPSDVTGDPTVINIDNHSFYKIGENKWKEHSSSGRVLSGSLTDDEIHNKVENGSTIKVYPSNKKNAKAAAKPDSTVKFDKTKSGKVGGIQVGKELATVIKTAPNGAKKLQEVTDKESGKTYEIYTDISSSKPDGIVAVEKKVPEKETKPSDGFIEKGDGSFSSPLVISTGSQSYQIWAEGTHIKGSMVGKQDSRNARDIFDFTNSGFDSFDEVKDYVKKYFFNQKGTPTKAADQPKDDSKASSTGVKLSKDDAKKMTQSFTSKIGKTDKERNDFMNKVKSQGITWKDKNDNGTEVSVAINWMRCLMAMNKHFANGGNFNE